MALHPHVIRKAQEELARIVELRKPAIRLRLAEGISAVDLNLSDKTVEDDIHKDYLISAGTTVIENIW